MLKKSRSRVRRRGFELLMAPNGLAQARLGVIVGRAYDKRSTRRHTFKRLVREAFRLRKHRLGGFDVLIRARQPEAEALLNQQLAEVLDERAMKIENTPVARRSIMSRPVRALMRAYQLTLSPLLGPRCRFYPSCSTYAMQAVQRHGVARGLVMAAKRLSKCHPWHPGGYDPVLAETARGG